MWEDCEWKRGGRARGPRPEQLREPPRWSRFPTSLRRTPAPGPGAKGTRLRGRQLPAPLRASAALRVRWARLPGPAGRPALLGSVHRGRRFRRGHDFPKCKGGSRGASPCKTSPPWILQMPVSELGFSRRAGPKGSVCPNRGARRIRKDRKVHFLKGKQ